MCNSCFIQPKNGRNVLDIGVNEGLLGGEFNKDEFAL